MTTLSRRRGGDTDESTTARRPRRSPSGDDKGAGVADEPRTRTRRTRGDTDDDKPVRTRRSGTGGFGSYKQKRQSNSTFASEFKPDSGKSTLIKFLDAEPFDVYNQHWIEDGDAGVKGARHSYVCRDDEYFDDDDGCPLCDLGESAATYALFNIVDLTNPRKPEVKVWKTSVTVADQLERIAGSDRTSPLNRKDLYFEVTVTKAKNKTSWAIESVKERDLKDDFDGMEALDEGEIKDFEEQRFTDRTSVTQVDDYDSLDKLAESLT